MEVNSPESLSKKDILWSYLAQVFSVGTNILTLPFILSLLSADEIGLNYIFITISSIISLVDLGFAPQFAKNFTYVLSGIQELKKEGIGIKCERINFELLGYLLITSKWIYFILSIIGLTLILAIGTPYVYHTTSGFTLVDNCLTIWIIYALGILCQVFYSYYFSMLIGAGKIKEQKYALIGNKILYLIIVILGLYGGFGLLSIAVGQFISPFFGRYLSHYYFYTPSIKKELAKYSCKNKTKIFQIFKTLWYNAKKSAVMSIGAYAILRFSMFVAGIFLTLTEFASYGLMIQCGTLLGNLSCTHLTSIQTQLNSLRSSGQRDLLIKKFARSYDIFIILFLIGGTLFICEGEIILNLIKSNASLPNKTILIVYTLIIFLEYNHINFSILISTNNTIPFAPASIITGICVCIGTFLILRFTSQGILGIILVQGICQIAYQNWRWPLLALSQFKISYKEIIIIGLKNNN